MIKDSDVLVLAEILNIKFDKFSFDDFKRGIDIELEHGSINPLTNVTYNNLLLTAKIALAHLLEFPNYYNEEYGLPAFEKMLENKMK